MRNTLLSYQCFFINSSFHHQGWTNESGVLGVRTPFHCPSKANKISRPPGRHMPALDFIWQTAIGCWIMGEICHKVNKQSFCTADINSGSHPVPCWVHRASYWSHGALSGLSITLDFSHSLLQNEEQNPLWLQPNSYFHGRAGLHMSPVLICILKRAANYIATAWARQQPCGICCLRNSKHQEACDELILPVIQEQLKLTGPWRDNDLPSPKQPSALNSPPVRGVSFALDPTRKILQSPLC